MRFLHAGQLEGCTKRISPHLIRGPVEAVNHDLQQFYQRLLAILRRPMVRAGEWRVLQCAPAWDNNWTSDSFVTFLWRNDRDERLLVAVNYAPHQSQCYVYLAQDDLAGRAWRLDDLLSADSYDRDGSDLVSRGLYLDMRPWQAAVFDISHAR
jgi:hypothetical protein